MSAFPKYDRYKDSGVEWLGEVPAHWRVDRIFALMNERVETGHGDLPILNIPIKPLNSRYYSYLFREPLFQTETNRHSYGIVSDRNRLYWLGFKNIVVPIPTVAEQDRIVAFLDRKTTEIDALIAKKQRQIELLDEQKAILINRAVTRGLNPNAKLKPSGIDWIGDIPEGWTVSSVRREAEMVTSGSRCWAQYSSSAGPLFLRICNLSRGTLEIQLDDIERVQPPAGSEGERTKVTAGDILISITAYIGSIGVVPEGFEEAYVSQHISLVRLKLDAPTSEWIGHALLSELGGIQSRVMMHGGTKVGLGLDDVKNYGFPVPPKTEQKQILEHLSDVISGHSKGVSQFNKEIKSLKGFRSNLIAHAVTGRIKV